MSPLFFQRTTGSSYGGGQSYGGGSYSSGGYGGASYGSAGYGSYGAGASCGTVSILDCHGVDEGTRLAGPANDIWDKVTTLGFSCIFYVLFSIFVTKRLCDPLSGQGDCLVQ